MKSFPWFIKINTSLFLYFLTSIFLLATKSATTKSPAHDRQQKPHRFYNTPHCAESRRFVATRTYPSLSLSLSRNLVAPSNLASSNGTPTRLIPIPILTSISIPKASEKAKHGFAPDSEIRLVSVLNFSPELFPKIVLVLLGIQFPSPQSKVSQHSNPPELQNLYLQKL